MSDDGLAPSASPAGPPSTYTEPCPSQGADDQGVRQYADVLRKWDRARLTRLAVGLAVHRVRAGMDPLGLSASAVSSRSALEIAGDVASLCRDQDTAHMVSILMGMTPA